MDTDARAEAALKRLEQFKSKRVNWDSHWTEIAERVQPHANNFTSTPTPGTKRTELMFDATAALALTRFASALESMLTPRTQRWHRLTGKPGMKLSRDAIMWLEYATDKMFEFRLRPGAAFASQIHEVYTSLGAYGTGPFFVGEIPGVGPYYRSIFLGEVYIAENQFGVVDTVYRCFTFTARQAYQKWGEALPDTIKLASDKQPDKPFEFVHCVQPNEDLKPGRLDYKGKPFASYYIALEGKKIVSEGGYRRFPYMVPRYITFSGEEYGRSPAMTVLSDIKMLNEMSRTAIRSAHRRAEPPLLIHDDGILTNIKLKPNAQNFGGVDEQGRAKVLPFNSGGDIGITLEMQDQRRKVINDAFLVTLFQILVEEARQMTATEVMERTREKAALLAPAMGRQQSELLGPMVERELDILLNNNLIEPPPPDLDEYEIVYESPLSKVMKAEDATGIYRWLEAIGAMAQYNQNVVNIPDYEAIIRDLASANNVPTHLVRSAEAIAKAVADQQKQAMVDQAVKAAPAIAGAAKNMTQAMQTATGVTGNQVPNAA